LVKSVDHSVVVSGALSMGSNGSVVGIVGISEVRLSLINLSLLVGGLCFIVSLSETEVGEISVTLIDLSLFAGDLILVANSGGIA